MEPLRLKIPPSAKASAKAALLARERFPKPPGLTKEQAGKLGINSGVERAKQLIACDYVEGYDLLSMARFYQRFRNQHSPRAEVAIGLWGGREFLEDVVLFLKEKNHR